MEDWELFLSRLQELKEDVTIDRFLHTYFSGEEHKNLRESVISFVEGYDAADTNKASTIALRDEWAGEEQANQYRMPGGYKQLVKFLEKESKAAGCHIELSARVTEIRWKKGAVEVLTYKGQIYSASSILITLPLGVLQADEQMETFVRFSPPIPEKLAAAGQIGFGGVIKFCLSSKVHLGRSSFSERKYRRMPQLGFLFSDAPVPTWWTQLPDPAPLLTGWLAGPEASQNQALSELQLRHTALQSLSYLFNTDIAFLEQQLQAYAIFNWLADPFSCGAYSYATVTTPEAKKTLTQPLAGTVYFAWRSLI
jgi:monoamine oxidase